MQLKRTSYFKKIWVILTIECYARESVYNVLLKSIKPFVRYRGPIQTNTLSYSCQKCNIIKFVFTDKMDKLLLELASPLVTTSCSFWEGT